ncbi:hypothetical protein GW17_00002174 [Ensete ventricosum]|nr:hypothetical protein GW17_00002174 [Ensete ventricosum]
MTHGEPRVTGVPAKSRARASSWPKPWFAHCHEMDPLHMAYKRAHGGDKRLWSHSNTKLWSLTSDEVLTTRNHNASRWDQEGGIHCHNFNLFHKVMVGMHLLREMRQETLLDNGLAQSIRACASSVATLASEVELIGRRGLGCTDSLATTPNPTTFLALERGSITQECPSSDPSLEHLGGQAHIPPANSSDRGTELTPPDGGNKHVGACAKPLLETTQ